MPYFKDLSTGITTVLTGMMVTFRHLFTPAVTVQYPREELPMNARTRARLVNHVEDCGYCLKCQKNCPVNIFTIKGVRRDPSLPEHILPDGKAKKITVTQFDIDLSKCVYCGLCVEACETHSLRWEAPVEAVSFTREGMFRRFGNLTPEQVAELMRQEEERKKAKAAAGPTKAPGGGKGPAQEKAGGRKED